MIYDGFCIDLNEVLINAFYKSICLGFEHYSGSLEKMRHDLVRLTYNDSSDKHTYHLRDVMLNLKNANGENEDDGCWYLKFFKEDIYILGLRLDFSEQDLWWLLDFRIRKKNYEKNDLAINNKIYFFDTDSDGCKTQKYAARNALLKAFGVEIVLLSGEDYSEKYQKAMEKSEVQLKNEINTEDVWHWIKAICNTVLSP